MVALRFYHFHDRRILSASSSMGETKGFFDKFPEQIIFEEQFVITNTIAKVHEEEDVIDMIDRLIGQ
jgi:hypothetical protein